MKDKTIDDDKGILPRFAAFASSCSPVFTTERRSFCIPQSPNHEPMDVLKVSQAFDKFYDGEEVAMAAVSRRRRRHWDWQVTS